MKLRILCLLSICFLGIFVLTGCGGAEGKLKGKTFSAEMNGEILGQLTFKENGVIDVKGNNSETGSVSYEIIDEGKVEYLKILDTVNKASVSDFLSGDTAHFRSEKDKYIFYWKFNEKEMKLESLALEEGNNVIRDFEGKKPDLSKLKEVKKEDTIKLIEEK
nr:hypothetical protein [Mammaliicoccus sp. Marseille-Q6498]